MVTDIPLRIECSGMESHLGYMEPNENPERVSGVPSTGTVFDRMRQKCAIPYSPRDLRASNSSTVSRAENAGSPANRASIIAADGAGAVETVA
jgi:hypothetical protein